MKKITSRVLLFSDPHHSIDSEKKEEKWFPPICNFLEKLDSSGRLVGKFLNFWDVMTQSAFKKVIRKAARFEPYDLAIGFGDYTPGANESGMLTEKTQHQYGVFNDVLNGIDCPKKLIWGDHDAGYFFEVSKKVGVKIGTEKGGLSVDSVKIAAKLIGPPFGCFQIENMKFIFISTNLVRNVNEESPGDLKKLKLEQENFLARTIHRSNGGRFFLLLHDPTSLTKETATRKIMDSHREKISAIFHGHLHAEFPRKLAMLSPVYAGLCSEYKTILVPASWGMFGMGGGFKILNIYNDGTYGIEKHSV